MNYYNPYFLSYPTMLSPATRASTGLLGRLTGNGFNLSTLLNGAQKTLGFVNQLIPVARQITPMMKNAKTMFRVMNEFKKVDTPSNPTISNSKNVITSVSDTPIQNTHNSASTTTNGPTFFI